MYVIISLILSDFLFVCCGCIGWLAYGPSFFFYQNELKTKTNYHNGLVNKVFTKMGDFCHVRMLEALSWVTPCTFCLSYCKRCHPRMLLLVRYLASVKLTLSICLTTRFICTFSLNLVLAKPTQNAYFKL